jgi:hypothetical protein
MYPARSRAWAGQVIFADGDAFFFDSPLSLMMYLGNVGHYTRGRTASAIVARYVTDMDSGAWVDAQQAVYVAGSSALGPMRAGNLPAFADRGAAQRFVQARGGRILGFDAIDKQYDGVVQRRTAHSEILLVCHQRIKRVNIEMAVYGINSVEYGIAFGSLAMPVHIEIFGEYLSNRIFHVLTFHLKAQFFNSQQS